MAAVGWGEDAVEPAWQALHKPKRQLCQELVSSFFNACILGYWEIDDNTNI